MSRYESWMVGNKKVSDEKSLQGAKMPKRNSSEKAASTPYDASHGLYLKKGGAVKKKELAEVKSGSRKKMALGGAAKIRKGMMTPKGRPKA